MSAFKPAAQDRQFVIAGQPYTLRFSMRALIAIEERYKQPIGAIGQRWSSEGMTMTDMVIMAWAGFRTHHPDVTEAQVVGWLDDGEIDTKQVVDTWEAAQAPKAEGEDPTPPPESGGEATAPGTGTGS